MGVGLLGLLCAGCGNEIPKDITTDKTNQQDPNQKIQQDTTPPLNSVGLPTTCKAIAGQGDCDKVLGCLWGSTCEEDTRLSNTLCGDKSQDDCIKAKECNYANVLDRCFDKEGSGKKPDAPTTCKGISELYEDAEKPCKEEPGCIYDAAQKTCGEDTAAKSTGDCNGKLETDCAKQPKCTWGKVLQKCFDEASVVMPLPTWNSCNDVISAKCADVFGCEPDGTGCRDSTTVMPAAPCDGLTTQVLCNANVFCGWSSTGRGCLKKLTVTIGNTCVDLGENTCKADPGCTWGAGPCTNSATPAAAPCNANVAKDACDKDIRCSWSGATGACYGKPVPRTGITSCADLPVGNNVCINTYGCEVNGDACQDITGFTTVSNTPCDGHHADKTACQNAGCVYSAFHVRPAAAGTMGGCFDPPGGHPGFCAPRSMAGLEAFCNTENTDAANCGNLAINTIKLCEHIKGEAEACAPIGAAADGKDRICVVLKATLGIKTAATGKAACDAIQVLQQDLTAWGAPCAGDNAADTCTAVNSTDFLTDGGGTDATQAYCTTAMAHAKATIADKRGACEGLSIIRTDNAQSATIKGTSICTYTPVVTAKCTLDPTKTDLCGGLQKTACENIGTTLGLVAKATCSWNEAKEQGPAAVAP